MDSKVISKRGYVIKKSILSNKDHSNIRKELTMVPFTLPGFQQDTKKFKLYQENDIPWIIGYSGGKDSTVVLQLIWIAISQLPKKQQKKPTFALLVE